MTSFSDKFKLTTNPFRMTPGVQDSELVWAGFEDVKRRLESRIKRSTRIQNSSLVLNWGEYGSGKTHAARFFSKNEELVRLKVEADAKSIPYSVVIQLPKGRNAVFSIYKSIIDQINIEKVRNDFEGGKERIIEFIEAISNNNHVEAVLKAFFNEGVDRQLLMKYLYGVISNSELKKLNEFGILRPFDDESDYTKFLSNLFSCLTYEKRIYSCFIIWIDEFEDISVLNNSNIDRINNFIREIFDNTPNNLLVFLNLTQSAQISVEDLSQYMHESVNSRIKDRINFELPTEELFKNYLADLLAQFRVGTDTNKFYPFDEVVVNNIITELGDVSLRKFNETLSLLLELSDLDEKYPINMEVYEEYRADIIY